jgi:CDP-ribitol ribitolphosphotransferase
MLTEFMFFAKPAVLFVPDLEEYERKRGFYVDYHSLSPFVVTQPEQLKKTVLEAIAHPDFAWVERCRQFHLASCDGHSTQRILDKLGL